MKTNAERARTLDEFGRVLLPQEIRRQVRLKPGDSIKIVVEGQDVIIRKEPV